MKRIAIPLYVAAALLAGALGCKEETPDISPLFRGKSATEGALRDTMARLEEDYGVAFEWDFLATDYSPVGFGMDLPYTKVTDLNSVLEVVQYIEKNVFSFFTPTLIKTYMPRNVFLVDSLISVYSHTDDLNEVYWTENRAITGIITDKYLVLGNVGDRFDPDRPGLQEELLSFFIEYLFNNNSIPPVPAGIKAATEKAAEDVGYSFYSAITGTPTIYYPYWEKGYAYIRWYTLSSFDDTPWRGRGILNIGRMGQEGYDYSVMGSYSYATYNFYKGTLAQDFADFAAFILLHPPAEREAFYAQVEADSRLDGDPRFPFAGPAGATAMRTKDGIVKAYIREHFGIPVE